MVLLQYLVDIPEFPFELLTEPTEFLLTLS
jgi:hypothetical protein